MATMKWTTPVLLLSLALFINNGACQGMSPRCKNLIDVVAVVDGSDSIADDDFLKLKEVLIKISEALGLKSTGPMFGVVVYSSTVSETAPLTSNQETLKSQISNFYHPKDGTATHLGIQSMTEMMREKGRDDVPKVGIVITDGRSKKPAATQTAATAARNADIKMFAVGVGQSINQTELKGIASVPENVLELKNFDELLNSVLSLVQRVCKVDGNWSEWNVTTGSCSVSCGGGSRSITRTRTCTNPPPSNGGLDCQGPNTETVSEACNTGGCPVNGNWSEWVETSTTCSVSCGGGSRTITKNRACTNPPPSNGGLDCQGPNIETVSEACNTGGCPVDGNWSEWVETSTTCSVSCGGGSRTITKNRACTNPPPSNGGLDCQGPNTETVSEACKTGRCPVPVDLCDGCIYVNGIGYMPYPSDCSKYVQCLDKGSKYAIMNCSPGTLWDQTLLICQHASSVSCGSSFPGTSECREVAGNKARYDQLLSGHGWVNRRCPPGKEFRLAKCDCVLPKDTVPETTTGTSECREVAGNKARYEQLVSGHGWVNRPCPPGTEFRLAKCDCVLPKDTVTPVPANPGCQPEVYLPCDNDLKDHSGRHTHIQNEGVTNTNGVAVFTRDSGLRILRFSNVDFGSTLVISFSLRRGERTERAQAIVSNADCGRQGSIYITQTSSTMEFTVFNKNNKACTISLPYKFVVGRRDRSMTACSLTVDGGYMTATVGANTKTISCPGDIATSQCAMQVGRGTGYDNFTGEIDEFTVSMCRSDVALA